MAGTKIAEAFVSVSADMAGLSAGMRQGQAITTSAVNSMQRSLGGLQSMLGMIGVGVGFGAIIGGIRGTIAEAQVAMDSQTRLAAAVETSGKAAGFTAGQLATFATELQNATTAGDETIKDAMTTLTTFPKVAGEMFKRATKAALDMQEKGFGGMGGNARMLGRALEDPRRGLMMLTRMGVTFSEQQRKQIKDLMEQNKLGEAQQVIMGAVEGKFKGVAEAMAKTPSGRIKQLTEATGDLREEIGMKLMPLMVRWKEVQFTITKAVLNFVDLAAPMIGGFADQWARLNESTGGFAASAAVAAASVATIIPVATKLFGAFKSGGMIASFFAPLLPFLPVILGVTAAVVAMGAAWKLAMQSSQTEGILAGLKDILANVQMLWTNVKSAADGIWTAISDAFGLATGSVTEAMGSAVASVVGFFQEVTYWLGAFSSNWPATWEIIKESSSIAMNWIGNVFTALADRWQTVLAAIVDMSLVTWTSITAALGAAFGAINWGALGEAFGNLMKTWAASSWGMIGGFSGVFEWLMDSWKSVLTKMLSAWQSYSMALPKALYAAIASIASGGTIGEAFSAAIAEGMKGVGDAMKGFGEVGAEAAGKFADGYSNAFGEAREALGITQSIGESLESIGTEAGNAARAAADAAMANVSAKMDRLKSEMAALAEAADTPELQARRDALAKQIGDLAVEYDKQKAAKAVADAKAEEKPETKPKPSPEEDPVAGKSSSPFVGFAELNRKMQEAMLKDTLGNKQLDVAEESLGVQKDMLDEMSDETEPVKPDAPATREIVKETIVEQKPASGFAQEQQAKRDAYRAAQEQKQREFLAARGVKAPEPVSVPVQEPSEVTVPVAKPSPVTIPVNQPLPTDVSVIPPEDVTVTTKPVSPVEIPISQPPAQQPSPTQTRDFDAEIAKIETDYADALRRAFASSPTSPLPVDQIRPVTVADEILQRSAAEPNTPPAPIGVDQVRPIAVRDDLRQQPAAVPVAPPTPAAVNQVRQVSVQDQVNLQPTVVPEPTVPSIDTQAMLPSTQARYDREQKRMDRAAAEQKRKDAGIARREAEQEAVATRKAEREYAKAFRKKLIANEIEAQKAEGATAENFIAGFEKEKTDWVALVEPAAAPEQQEATPKPSVPAPQAESVQRPLADLSKLTMEELRKVRKLAETPSARAALEKQYGGRIQTASELYADEPPPAAAPLDTTARQHVEATRNRRGTGEGIASDAAKLAGAILGASSLRSRTAAREKEDQRFADGNVVITKYGGAKSPDEMTNAIAERKPQPGLDFAAWQVDYEKRNAEKRKEIQQRFAEWQANREKQTPQRTASDRPPGASATPEMTDVADNTAQANTLLGKLVTGLDVMTKKLEPKTKPILAGA